MRGFVATGVTFARAADCVAPREFFGVAGFAGAEAVLVAAGAAPVIGDASDVAALDAADGADAGALAEEAGSVAALSPVLVSVLFSQRYSDGPSAIPTPTIAAATMIHTNVDQTFFPLVGPASQLSR